MNSSQKISLLLLSVLLAPFANYNAHALLANHAPSLIVHETLYGIEVNTQRQSVERIFLRIGSFADPKDKMTVQCFFLKKGKLSNCSTSLPLVDDTVIFDLPPSHGSYEVTARPIRLSTAPKPSKSKSSKKSSKKKTTSTPAVVPREGFIVRILHDGLVLRSYYSNHQMELFANEHPELLEKATAKKSARRFIAKDLAKR